MNSDPFLNKNSKPRIFFTLERSTVSPTSGDWLDESGCQKWEESKLDGVPFLGLIIPFSKWLITMVNQSPKWDCSPSKWPFYGL